MKEWIMWKEETEQFISVDKETNGVKIHRNHATYDKELGELSQAEKSLCRLPLDLAL